VTTYHFTITRLDTGQLIGHALLCPAHYYVGVQWAGRPSVETSITTPARWQSIDADLLLGWEKGLVSATSATALTVAGTRRSDVLLRLVGQPHISERPGANAIGGFEAYLEAQAIT
jgi:hypothetical protein